MFYMSLILTMLESSQKKRVLWTRIEATLNRQSAEILTEFRRLR